ncbi:TetR/AcrR family transcriptional regulator [Caldinitratiruptor microaerophilus]|uniref:TetR family transcriptional regulator n=1 Tax=Caldinitratiruptor microaerophilus TaxID=671077 RepID=A0AA35CL68_9FIRM|nr:TetR/AcrR family transcriptional regulator [Caldinitratiruptor microaerophilus]BDG61349.1 TetR family transcriptional regulator [Caldinitratiruptor microaerophilus]
MSTNKLTDIVNASVELFMKKGYHATSMQDIADAVGLQKGSLYHYISSKEDLLVMIIQEALDQYIGRLAEIAASDLPPREKFAQAVRHHLMGIATNLGHLTIFLREAYALTPEQQAIVKRETERYNRLVERIYQEGVEQGVFRPLDPPLVIRTVLGACNWFYRWYRPGGRMSLEEMADFFVDVLFNGIVVR